MFQAASPSVLERGRACMIAMETARTLAKEQNSKIYLCIFYILFGKCL